MLHGAALPPHRPGCSTAHLARSCGSLLLLCCSRGGALHANTRQVMTSEACESTRVGASRLPATKLVRLLAHTQACGTSPPHLSSRWAWQQDDLGLRQVRLLVVVGSDSSPPPPAAAAAAVASGVAR